MSSLYAPTDEVKRRLRPFGLFFEKSLKDLIKGIRSQQSPEQLQDFLTKVLSECREEVKHADFNLKTNAVLKLTYLEMYGFDMSWANFHVLEVMSSTRFQQKRVGYLAASQSFYKDHDILMLATNLLRKDLKYSLSNETVRMGVALSGLSAMVTPELARDICEDLFLMLHSTKPYIRKKAVTALFKVFLQYPEGLRDNFEKFVDRLEDDDLSVVSATVSVICELSKHNPQPFIQLSPILYQMLIKVDNNWVIIRLLKLFTNLAQIEPKLRVKILPNVLELMDSTTAISVVYESINCIVKGNMLNADDYDSAVACLDKLHDFCTSNDPNLRYLSCVLFYKIGKINTDFIANFDVLILRLLVDVDVSIRSKTLELLEGIVNEDNLVDFVQRLLKQFVDVDKIYVNDQEFSIDIPEYYKSKMIHAICKITSMKNYANITDFEWYIALLSDLCIVSQDLQDKTLAQKLGEQIRNIMVKVPDLRDRTLAQIVQLVKSEDITARLPGVLKECIWCLGEYSSLLENKDEYILLLAENSKYYAPELQQTLIPAILKIYSNWCNGPTVDIDRIKLVTERIITPLEELIISKNFEVQERSSEALEFLRLCLDSLSEETSDSLPLLLTEVLPSFFNAFELQPITSGTQRKLQQSINVDCDTPFLTESELEQLLADDTSMDGIVSPDVSETESDAELHVPGATPNDNVSSSTHELTTAELEAINERRKQERVGNPFYLDDADVESVKKADILDNISNSKPSSSGSLVRLSSESKAKEKKKKVKVRVISDAVIVDGGNTADDTDDRPSSAPSARNKIALQLKNKLDSFDFTKPRDDGDYDPDVDLQKLREKFAQQRLIDESAAAGEEVVVVKKKKRSKDGSKSSKKKSRSKSKPSSKGDDTAEAELLPGLTTE
ncbi:AaceriAFL076Wp [[Ashbya] aceris (nom. inval.)]|nr:AaceriAFL076Wp [[Ashbya] aceris (nom. inval.)]